MDISIRLPRSLAFEPPTASFDAIGHALDSLIADVCEHDRYTGDHSCRVSDYAEALGRVLGLDDDDVVFLRQAGLAHDIGKIGIPDELLTKSGPLSDDEFNLIKTHPLVGANLLARIKGMERMVPVARHHHERWDGTGYPSGLAGVDIPIGARIVFVADAFDAMTSRRPYGRVLSTEQALAELRRCSGRQFDPVMVDAMHSAYHNGLIDDLALAPSGL
ncbi:MAG: HD-GYP domain-containing protein [Actinomycetota bacterium]